MQALEHSYMTGPKIFDFVYLVSPLFPYKGMKKRGRWYCCERCDR